MRVSVRGTLAMLATATLTITPAIAQPSEDITVPALPGMDKLGLSNIIVSAPFDTPAGAIRQEFGGPGSHPIASTTTPVTCDDIVYDLYNKILTYNQGINDVPQCYDVFPTGTSSVVGSQLVYPTDLAAGEKAPLIVLSPGVGANPGMLHRQAELYASHGYIVAVGYNFVNFWASHLAAAAITAWKANAHPGGPLQGHVDFSRTLFVGHSAGGGAVVSFADAVAHGMRTVAPEFQVRGVVGVHPAPSTLGATPPTTAPTLHVIAENESLVPHPLSRIAYDRQTGPRWWAVMDGAFHGTFGDAVDRNAYGGLVLSFAEYQLQRTPRSVAVYEGDGLASDIEVVRAERAGL